MATPYTIACTVHCSRAGRGGPSALQAGPKTTGTPWSGRVPRLARLMALALRFDKLLHEGVVKNSLTLARLGRVSQARISQILSLLHLAPDTDVIWTTGTTRLTIFCRHRERCGCLKVLALRQI